MASLKAFAAEIAAIVGSTPAAVYERQRALIRAGIFPEPESRGRGHGLEALPETVAILLIALLATDSMSETDERVGALAKARFDDITKPKCELTGTSRFGDALTAILQSKEIASRVWRVEVSRTSARATIWFRRGRNIHQSNFGNERAMRMMPAIEVEAKLSDFAIRNIMTALKRWRGVP